MPYSIISLLSFPIPLWMVALMMIVFGGYALRNRNRAHADAIAERTESATALLEVGSQLATVGRAPVKRLTMDDLRPRRAAQR
jgi:hypothetical protein